MSGSGGDPAGRSSDTRGKWWQWVIGGLVLFVVLSVIFGDDTKTATVTNTVTVTRSVQPPQTQTTAAERAEAMTEARRAADSDDYTAAVAMAAALGSHQEEAIRRRIANRIARGARAAVLAGDRGRAKRLLARAERFPTTALTRAARSGYRAAKERAAERALARRVAAEQERVAAEQRRRDEQPAQQGEPDTGGNCDPNYSGCVPVYPPDVNCPEVAGSVQVLGGDPHGLDGDGDGVACE